jgi:hypothetical protein
MGNGERGGDYRSDAPCSSLWPTQRRNERSGICSVSGVVPQGRFAHGPGAAVKHDHAVLLRRDRYCRDLGSETRFVEGSRYRYLPGNGIGFASTAIAFYFVAS